MPGDDDSRVAFAIELRSELLNIYCGDSFVREGSSDHLEIGRSMSSDYVEGHEDVRVGGNLLETTGHGRTTVVHDTDIKVEGGMALEGWSETTLIGGGMRETHLGAEFVGAAMSDDMIAGAGARVTAPIDLWACGLYGMEENIGVAAADGALTEAYGMALDREFVYGMHNIGTACFSGALYNTQASGVRGLIRSTTGASNIVPGAGKGDGATAGPGSTPPPPGDPGAVTGNALALGRSGRGFEDTRQSRFLVDAVQAGEDVAQTVPELEDTRLIDAARFLDYTEVLESADEFMLSEDGVKFFRQGESLTDVEDVGAVGEDGVRTGVAGGESGAESSIFDSPWEHRDWYEEQIGTRRQRPLPETPRFQGEGGRILGSAPDSALIDPESPHLSSWDQLEFRIAELEAWRDNEIAEGNPEIAHTLDTSIKFLQCVQEQLAQVDEAGNSVHASPIDALNAAYDEFLKTAEPEQVEFLDALRDDYRRAWNDPTAPPSPEIDDARPVASSPLVHTAQSLVPEGTGPSPKPLPEPDPDALWGLYAISSPIGPQVPGPGGVQPVADNVASAGTEVDQIVEFEALYAASNPLGVMEDGFGSGDEPVGGGVVYQNLSELPAPGSSAGFSSSDDAGGYSRLVHTHRVEYSNSLSVEGTVVGSDEYARLSATGVLDDQVTPPAIYDELRPENIDPNVRPISDELRPENIDPSVQSMYDELRPENFSASYGELAGSPVPVWNSQEAPSVTMMRSIGPEYDRPPLERLEHDYEEIGAYWNRGPQGWQGPIWKPGADSVAAPPTDFGIERAILAGEVPEGVDTAELAAGWRRMEELYRQQAADLAARGRTGEAANVLELAEVYGDMARKLSSGEFSLDELRNAAARWTANSFQFPENAMGAQAIAGMVTEYQSMISDAMGWRADPDWLAAVARLDAAEQSGDAHEIVSAQRGLADLFDEKFPPPSWIDGQRPTGDDIYSVPETVVARKVSNDFRPSDWDPSRTPPIETVQFYADADAGNKLVITSEETFELIQQGLVKVELFGDFTGEDGSTIFKLVQDQDNVLRVGDYDIVLDPAAVTPPMENIDEFVRQWHADRAARVKAVGDFLEDDATAGSRIENLPGLLENIPEAHGFSIGVDSEPAFTPSTFGTSDRSNTLATAPADVEVESAHAENLARYYSEGAGRGNAAITSADINSPILEDPVDLTASVEVGPPATPAVENGAPSGALGGVGNGASPPVSAQRWDLLFSPYAEPDDAIVNRVMVSESTVRRTVAAQDAADGRARVIISADSMLPSVTDSGLGGRASRIGGSGDGTASGPAALTGAGFAGSGEPEPIYHTLEPPIYATLEPPTPARIQWLDPLPYMLLSGGSHGVALASEPQLVDVMFQTWFHQLVEVTRPVNELADADGADGDGDGDGDGRSAGGTGSSRG